MVLDNLPVNKVRKIVHRALAKKRPRAVYLEKSVLLSHSEQESDMRGFAARFQCNSQQSTPRASPRCHLRPRREDILLSITRGASSMTTQSSLCLWHFLTHTHTLTRPLAKKQPLFENVTNENSISLICQWKLLITHRKNDIELIS